MDGIEDVVRARRFELVDNNGDVRAVLSVESDTGVIGLHVGNNEGIPVISIGVEPSTNVPFLILRRGPEETPSISMTIVPAHNGPAIHLEGANGGGTLLTVTQEGTEPGILLTNGDGDERSITVNP